MQDRSIGSPGIRIAEGSDVATQAVVDREGVDIRNMTSLPKQAPDSAGTVTDGVSLVRGGHPLVDHQAHSVSRPFSFASSFGSAA